MAHLSKASADKIGAICDRFRDEPTPLIMILSEIQKEFGYIPLEVQELVSERTGISVAEIYGVVTFYSFFSLEPKGKYVIGCCLGTACYVKGAQQLLDQLCEILGVQRRTDFSPSTPCAASAPAPRRPPSPSTERSMPASRSATLRISSRNTAERRRRTDVSFL